MEEQPNEIVQEVPNYCDGVKPKRSTFATQDELLAIDWVKRDPSENNFHRFSLSGNILMIEKDEGRYWWAIGYVKFPKRLELPEWKPVRVKQ